MRALSNEERRQKLDELAECGGHPNETEAAMSKGDKSVRIRELNDLLRRTFTGGEVVLTDGAAALSEGNLARLLEKVKAPSDAAWPDWSDTATAIPVPLSKLKQALRERAEDSEPDTALLRAELQARHLAR
jgi:hypothetical protein